MLDPNTYEEHVESLFEASMTSICRTIYSQADQEEEETEVKLHADVSPYLDLLALTSLRVNDRMMLELCLNF